MNLVKRSVADKLHKCLNIFPVVAIVGPRQAGKTTFARMELPAWKYFDLEKPSDFSRIAADREFFLSQYGDNCIIDEAQVLPELFPVIRSHIDNSRLKKGRLVLLGSVNPLLIQSMSESLAGRIGFIEIDPFTFREATAAGDMDIEQYWLRGGYPEPLYWEPAEHQMWMEHYVKTFVERDVLRLLKTSLSSQRQMQMLVMLAHSHGRLWNASQIAAAFGVSYHSVNRYIELMENYYLIRRLIPYYRNIGKRLVKSHKFYFRDTGLLHYLLQISGIESLRVSPYRGFSFEGFVIEQLIQKYGYDVSAPTGIYFYRTAKGDEIDLLIERDNRMTAYEIKTSVSVDLRDLRNYQNALEQLNVEKGTVVYFGRNDFMLTPTIEVKSVRTLLLGD